MEVGASSQLVLAHVIGVVAPFCWCRRNLEVDASNTLDVLDYKQLIEYFHKNLVSSIVNGVLCDDFSLINIFI